MKTENKKNKKWERLGCQEMKNKKELVRIVRTQEGEVSLDFTGKKPGRGAYICPNQACLEASQKARGLERSFKAGISHQIYETLKEELAHEHI